MATQEKLTKRFVDGAMPRDVRYTIFDRHLSGFGLRVAPSGVKTYIFEYRPGEGGRAVSKKRVTIGRVGDITPDQARKLAEKLKGRVLNGEDPQDQKSRQRKASSLAEIGELFLRDHVAAKRSSGTLGHYRDIIDRIIVPELGHRKAKDVTRSDVAALHLKWKHTPYQANRVLSVLSSLYGFAAKLGLVPEGMNPARGVEKYKEEGRERFLSAEELARLGSTLRLAETEGLPWEISPEKKSKHTPKLQQSTIIDPYAAAAIRLLLFTGARLREILHLKWDQVDLDRGMLFLSKSKTGKKTIILNAPAMAVIASLPQVGSYVIAGRASDGADEKPRADLKRPWAAVSRHAGLEGVRLHDLRHNFAAFGAGGGMGLPIIGKLLGHTQAATTQRYAHLDADPLRHASNAIGSSIADALNNETVTTSSGTHPTGR